MCDSLANTVSKLDGNRLVGYIVCETCGNHTEVSAEDYSPDPKLEMPTPPSQ